MVDREALLGYGVRDGVAVVSFADGRELRLVPQWQGDSVRCLEAVGLVLNGDAIAIACEDGYWTSGDVAQAELGGYCAFAIDLERQVYRFYRQKKIDEIAWQQKFRSFWKIAIKCRQMMLLLQATSLPVLHEKPEGERV